MGKKTVWDIELEINGKDSGASKALLNLQRNMKDVQAAGKQLSSDFKNFTGNAGKLALGVVAGVAAAGAATLKLAGDFATAGDQAAKTADSLGMGIEGYQRLRYAMGTAGVEAGEFDSAIQKMSNTIKMGAAGSEAQAKQLAEIGLSAKELAGMKPEEVFAKISDEMQSLPSDAERTRVAITLFGKTAGPKMMNAMRMGSEGLREMGDEAQILGIIINEEQARASESYLDAMARMQGGFTGLKNQFIGSAIGPITQAFDHLKDAMVEQGPLMQELGQKFGNFLAQAVEKLPEIIQKIKEFWTWIKETVTKVVDFVGGFKNLAKILAGLAIAPTLISGLKVVFSLGNFIKVVIGAIGPLVTGLAGGFGALAAAALPIIGIIAGIAAAIAGVVLIVKNWEKITAWIKEHKETLILVGIAVGTLTAAIIAYNIAQAVANAGGIVAVARMGAQAVATGVLSAATGVWNVVAGIAAVATTAFGAAMAFLTSPITLVVLAIGAVIAIIYLLVKNWDKVKETAVKVWGTIVGAVKAAWEFIKNIFGKIGEFFSGIFTDPIGTIKAIISEIGGFFKNVFQGSIDAVKGIIDGFAEKFGGVFASIKEKIESFVNFFKEKMEAVKDFFGGIGDKIGGLFNGGRNNNVPGHASGGIFTQPHIAQIAEAGAEAVVPLNRSPQGFDIWKQAGELGGYVDRMNQQTQTTSTSGTPPVMEAAAQKISTTENVITINFSQNNTFSGGTPDKETVNQISVAGRQAADDLEARVKQILDNIKRDQRRLSYV